MKQILLIVCIILLMWPAFCRTPFCLFGTLLLCFTFICKDQVLCCCLHSQNIVFPLVCHHTTIQHHFVLWLNQPSFVVVQASSMVELIVSSCRYFRNINPFHWLCCACCWKVIPVIKYDSGARAELVSYLLFVWICRAFYFTYVLHKMSLRLSSQNFGFVIDSNHEVLAFQAHLSTIVIPHWYHHNPQQQQYCRHHLSQPQLDKASCIEQYVVMVYLMK